MTRTHLLIVAFSTACYLSGCSDQPRTERTLSGHNFSIPNDYIFDANIFYLPNSQDRGLRIIVNPTAPQEKQILVSIDPASSCPRIEGSPTIDARCKAVAFPLRILQTEKFKRVPSQMGDVWWSYQSDRMGLIATCSALANGGDGLCMHHGVYKDLAYTIHLRDRQIPYLIRIRQLTEQKLSEWEKI